MCRGRGFRSLVVIGLALVISLVSVPSDARSDSPGKKKFAMLVALVHDNGIVVPIAEYRTGKWTTNPNLSQNDQKPWKRSVAQEAEWHLISKDGGSFRTSGKTASATCGCEGNIGFLIENRTAPDPERSSASCLSSDNLAYATTKPDDAEWHVSPALKSEKPLLHADRLYQAAAARAGKDEQEMLRNFTVRGALETKSYYFESDDTDDEDVSSLHFFAAKQNFGPADDTDSTTEQYAIAHGWLRESKPFSVDFGAGAGQRQPLARITIDGTDYVFVRVVDYEYYGFYIFKVGERTVERIAIGDLGGC